MCINQQIWERPLGILAFVRLMQFLPAIELSVVISLAYEILSGN